MNRTREHSCERRNVAWGTLLVLTMAPWAWAQDPPTLTTRDLDVEVVGSKEFTVPYTYSGDKKDLSFTIEHPQPAGALQHLGEGKYLYTGKTSFTGSDKAVFAVKSSKLTDAKKATVTFTVKPKPPEESLVSQARKTAPGQYDPERVKRLSTCSFDDSKGVLTLACDPGAIEVSAADASRVIVELPSTVTRVVATSGETWPIPELNSHSIEFGTNCPRRDSINVELHRRRVMGPSFSKNLANQFPSLGTASKILRDDAGTCPDYLSLLLSSRQEGMKVTIYYLKEGKEASFSHDLQLLYYRWFVDIGGFYALRETGDDRIVTRALSTEEGEDPKTEVLRIDRPDRTSDTGIMLTFVPRNYPHLGANVGLAFPQQRSPSYYVGGSIRLLSLGPSAVATLTGGLVYTEIKTFPGISATTSEIEAVYDTNDPRLQGSIDYDEAVFVGVTLGFELPSRAR